MYIPECKSSRSKMQATVQDCGVGRWTCGLKTTTRKHTDPGEEREKGWHGTKWPTGIMGQHQKSKDIAPI